MAEFCYNLFVRFLAIILFGLSLLASAQAQATLRTAFSSLSPRQGDPVVVSFAEQNLKAESITFDGKPVAFFKYQGGYRALFAVPANKKPGTYTFLVRFSDGRSVEQGIKVRARAFPEVELGIPEKLALTPKALTQNLATTNKNLAPILAKKEETVYFNRPFGLPLRDNRNIGSPFGEIRKTGTEEIMHMGVDLNAKIGTPVYAINSGLVQKAYTDTIYGKSVIIDHGQGIFSMYLHLNDILVKEGEAMKKGKIIGRVGDTGYATAPHLHLSLKLSGVSVDPFRFVSAFK